MLYRTSFAVKQEHNFIHSNFHEDDGLIFTPPYFFQTRKKINVS